MYNWNPNEKMWCTIITGIRIKQLESWRARAVAEEGPAEKHASLDPIPGWNPNQNLWYSTAIHMNIRGAQQLVPVVRADLGRPVAPFLVHTDACESGAARVYTHEVPLAELERECVRA